MKRILIIVTFSLHNAYNCWFFLNFTNFKPAESLYQVSEADIGLITTAGWIGIIVGLPLLVTKWHRSMLLFSGFLNTAPSLLRSYVSHNLSEFHGVDIVILTNFLAGVSFGVLGAWPAMLASQWPQEWRATITAICSLSNYAGGTAAVLTMPLIADEADGLLRVFEYQSYIAIALMVSTLTWSWIPPYESSNSTDLSTSVSALTLRLSCNGLIIGITLLLQGMNQYVFSSFGFSDFASGAANSVYQGTAAVSGVALSLRVVDVDGVFFTRRKMVTMGAFGYLFFCVFLLTTGGKGKAAECTLYFLNAILGSTLMGALPLLLLESINEVNYGNDECVGENVVCGVVYFEAIAVAAVLTFLTTDESGSTTILVVGGLLIAALTGTLILDRREMKKSRETEVSRDNKKLLLRSA